MRRWIYNLDSQFRSIVMMSKFNFVWFSFSHLHMHAWEHMHNVPISKCLFLHLVWCPCWGFCFLVPSSSLHNNMIVSLLGFNCKVQSHIGSMWFQCGVHKGLSVLHYSLSFTRLFYRRLLSWYWCTGCTHPHVWNRTHCISFS